MHKKLGKLASATKLTDNNALKYSCNPFDPGQRDAHAGDGHTAQNCNEISLYKKLLHSSLYNIRAKPVGHML